MVNSRLLLDISCNEKDFTRWQTLMAQHREKFRGQDTARPVTR